mmetsp:Transcript_47380/g.138112  ORF Transcript_47380/g.138112 Transcript_47380/m.138112 type:complete len:232 (+) Transcript_47380:1034-1729(+)
MPPLHAWDSTNIMPPSSLRVCDGAALPRASLTPIWSAWPRHTGSTNICAPSNLSDGWLPAPTLKRIVVTFGPPLFTTTNLSPSCRMSSTCFPTPKSMLFATFLTTQLIPVSAISSSRLPSYRAIRQRPVKFGGAAASADGASGSSGPACARCARGSATMDVTGSGSTAGRAVASSSASATSTGSGRKLGRAHVDVGIGEVDGCGGKNAGRPIIFDGGTSVCTKAMRMLDAI